jgi:lipopolysaccharide/colanic/teichoic acid biosynthesis glycosyltransferase
VGVGFSPRSSNGRSTCSYEERMEMELYYVENANFWWDCKIVLATFGAVIRGHGAQ